MFNLLKPNNQNTDRILLAALAFVLPFERIPSFDVAGITVRSSLIVGGLVILRALQKIISSRRIELDIIEKLVLAYCAWLIALIPVAINKPRAIQVIVFTLFVAMVAMGVKRLLRREFLKSIFKALIYSTIAVSAFGIYQYFGNLNGLGENLTGLQNRYAWWMFGFPRVQSVALEPLYLASFLLLPLSLIVSRVIIKGRNHLAVATLAIGSLILFMTVSRGGTVAYLVAACALAVLGFAIKQGKRAMLCVAAIAVGYGMSLFILGNFSKPASSTFTQRSGIESYTTQIKQTGLEGKGDDRSASRKLALDIFLSSPQNMVFGVGPGQFGPKVQNNEKIGGHWSIVNNEPLELLAESGVVGAGLIAAMFIILIYRLFAAGRKMMRKGLKNEAYWTVGLAAFFLAIAGQYQTFSTLYIVHIWVALGLALGVLKYIGELGDADADADGAR